MGGIDTTSTTVEWQWQSYKITKTRAELKEVIGQKEIVQESDISGLPYLLAVIKETFRLHPPAPLIPHAAIDDVEINGYVVPKNTKSTRQYVGLEQRSCKWGQILLSLIGF